VKRAYVGRLGAFVAIAVAGVLTSAGGARADSVLKDFELVGGFGGGSQRLDAYRFAAPRGVSAFEASGADLGYGGTAISFFELGLRWDFRWLRVGVSSGMAFPISRRDSAPRREVGPVALIGSGGLDMSLRLPLDKTAKTTLFVGALAGPRFTFVPLRGLPEATCSVFIPTSTSSASNRGLDIPYECAQRAHAALWYVQPRVAFEYAGASDKVSTAVGGFLGIDVLPTGAPALVAGLTIALRISILE